MVKNIEVCSVCSKGGGGRYSFYIKCTLVGVTSCRARPFLLSLTLNYFNTEYKTLLCLLGYMYMHCNLSINSCLFVLSTWLGYTISM